MKLSGFVGTGSGKLGNSVFMVRGGQQIVRQYQPIVLNPKSSTQREQRAKWKAAVQLSAVMGDVLYPFKQDAPANVSARNRFVQTLFKSGAVTYNTGKNQAEINKNLVKLSPSSISWRFTTTLTFTGSAITGSVFVIDEVSNKNAVLTLVILHNEVNGQPLITGIKSFDVSGTEVSINMTSSEPLRTDDTLLMVLAIPENSKLAGTYRDILWSSTDGAYIVPVMVSNYASAFRYLKSYNQTINIA